MVEILYITQSLNQPSVPQTDVSTKPIHHSPKDVVRQHTTFSSFYSVLKMLYLNYKRKFFSQTDVLAMVHHSHNLRESLTKITTYNFMKRLTVLTILLFI
jgi:hypothetical protein